MKNVLRRRAAVSSEIRGGVGCRVTKTCSNIVRHQGRGGGACDQDVQDQDLEQYLQRSGEGWGNMSARLSAVCSGNPSIWAHLSDIPCLRSSLVRNSFVYFLFRTSSIPRRRFTEVKAVSWAKSRYNADSWFLYFQMPAALRCSALLRSAPLYPALPCPALP